MDTDPPPRRPFWLSILALLCGLGALPAYVEFGLPGIIPAIACGILALVLGQRWPLAVLGLALGCLAPVLMPDFRHGCGVAANEAAASASLKSGIFPAQVMFQQQARRDADADAVGEYGTIAELAATPAGSGMTLLCGPFRGKPGPVIDASAYHFIVYLPDGRGGAISSRTGAIAPEAVDDQERHWVAYAWPISPGPGQRRRFAIAEDGQVRTPIADPGDRAPAWNDVFAGQGWDATPVWPIYCK